MKCSEGVEVWGRSLYSEGVVWCGVESPLFRSPSSFGCDVTICWYSDLKSMRSRVGEVERKEEDAKEGAER